MSSPYNYGAFASGQATPQPAAVPERPKSVDIGFWLLIASTALTALAIVLLLNVFSDPEFRTFLTKDLDLTSSETDNFMTVAIAGVIIFGLVSMALNVLLGIFARQGRNWARIVLLVFACLSVTGLIAVNPSAYVIASVMSILLYIAAAVMFFLAPSSAYMKQMTQYRQSKKPGYTA